MAHGRTRVRSLYTSERSASGTCGVIAGAQCDPLAKSGRMDAARRYAHVRAIDSPGPSLVGRGSAALGEGRAQVLHGDADASSSYRGNCASPSCASTGALPPSWSFTTGRAGPRRRRRRPRTNRPPTHCGGTVTKTASPIPIAAPAAAARCVGFHRRRAACDRDTRIDHYPLERVVRHAPPIVVSLARRSKVREIEVVIAVRGRPGPVTA